METKSANPKLKQSEIAKQLGCTTSTLQRYRQDTNMLSPYRIPSNEHKRRQKISNKKQDDHWKREHDLKRHQMTSKDLKTLESLNPTQMRTLLSTAKPKRKTDWKVDPRMRLMELTMNK